MSIRLSNPLPGAPLTDSFGPRGTVPGLGDLGFHNGQDFAADRGTPILSAHAGVVRSFWDNQGGGYSTIVDAGDYFTQYSHMDGPGHVRDGQYVPAGRKVGLVGSSGLATGPHLHFILFINGTGVVDPMKYMRGATPVAPKPSTPEELPTMAADMFIQRNSNGTKYAIDLTNGPGRPKWRAVSKQEWEVYKIARRATGLGLPVADVSARVMKELIGRES